MKEILNYITPEVMANLEIGLGIFGVAFLIGMGYYCVVKKDFRF